MSADFLTAPQRRIVTHHTPAQGTPASSSAPEPTVLVHDDTIDPPDMHLPQEHPAAKVKAACLWTTNTSPGQNSFDLTMPEGDAAVIGANELVTKGGTNLRLTVLDPHAVAGMHRTSSVDYNIFTHGSAYLITPEYDSEGKETLKETLCKAGDVVIQRGTLHAWKATEEGTRWISVLVDAHPVVTPPTNGSEGFPLEDVHL